MLTRLQLTNFKAFGSLALPFAPLTLLCGVNGAGKSTIVQALLLLRQSARSGVLWPPKIRLELDGPLAEIGTGRDALHEDAETDVLAFDLQDTRVSEPCSLSFRVLPDEGGDSDQLHGIESSELPQAWQRVPPFGGELLYVSADRVGPRKFYDHSETMALRGDLGTRCEYAFNYLSERGNFLLDGNDPRQDGVEGRRTLDVIDRWVAETSPGARLGFEKIVRADALVVGFSFDRPSDVPTRRFRATNVGFGLSYSLPVLTALLAAPGALCLIENPEAHLHPRGQTRMAELAARAALAGVQVVVETHSDHFLDGVRIAVRDALIAPEQVAVHYFDRTGTQSVVTSPTLDGEGRLSSWPAGFFDQHEDNLARLLAPKS